MSIGDIPAIEGIIADTIEETARGDPNALAGRIVVTLAKVGYHILPANGIEDTARISQPFDELTREKRPQDPYGDGRDWTFRTGEHGGDEPDNMPQAIEATDAAGRWAIYVPLTREGKIVVPRPYSTTCTVRRASDGSIADTSDRLPRVQSMKRATARQLYQSPNGDTWFLARDPAMGVAFVRHEANAPSGGQVTDIEIGAFLNGPRNPEHDALLRLIGNAIVNPHRADTRDDRLAESTAKEWSDAELIELGDMLIRGLSIEEIARLLRRDHGDVQDKVVEIGRACREGSSIARRSEPAKVFEDRKSRGDWRVEKLDDDSGVEVAIFGGANARERAIQYADWRYREFEEISLAPVPDKPC